MNRISESTRRDILDALVVESVRWSGRLGEPDFLARLFDLQSLPSNDNRFTDAYSDIYKHQVMNEDWNSDWVFYDSRFNLLHGDDETFLRFLCEMLHPVVRSDSEEVERLRQSFNSILERDGYEIVERAQISQRPIFAARLKEATAVSILSGMKKEFRGVDVAYVVQQITRMEAAIRDDAALAIGTAKELIETCCKTILKDKNKEVARDLNLPQLVKFTVKELQLVPEDVSEHSKASDTIRRVLGSLATITQGLAELRNDYGTGHGKHARSKGLGSRHAKLAVGAASTLALFLMETHREGECDKKG